MADTEINIIAVLVLSLFTNGKMKLQALFQSPMYLKRRKWFRLTKDI